MTAFEFERHVGKKGTLPFFLLRLKLSETLARKGRVPFLLFLLTGAMLALGGCALQRPAPVVDWTARAERVAALPSWEARGRIAIKAEEGGGQGDLRWEQRGSKARVRVSGPFGAGAYEIRWDPAQLSISSRNGDFSRAYEGPDAAEQFLREQIGWSFPAMSTRFWLLGIPDPAFPARQTFSEQGELRGLDQNGWAVTYERYTDASGVPMPAKITVQNPRARVRLVIDRWCLSAGCAAPPSED